MFELFDEYCWTKQMKVITKDKHNVPGLGNFAYWNYTTSVAPSPSHYHTDIIEIHCIVKGKKVIQITKNGRIIQYNSTGNQAILSFPFELHSNGNQPQSPCELYAFQVCVSDPYNLLGLNREYSYELYKSLLGLTHSQVQLGSTHLSQLRNAFNLFSTQDPSLTMIGVQSLVCFLFNLPFLSPVPATEERDIDQNIFASISFLNNRLCENLRLSDLAKVSGYSLSRFKVKFKEEIGITPAEYITLQKIDLAKKKLIETNINITDLSCSLGFSSSNYFSSVFKKITSFTPMAYRKQYEMPNIPTKRKDLEF